MDGTGSGTVEQSTAVKIGKVLHFFSRISVAAIEISDKITDTLEEGDTVRFFGKEGRINFTQKVGSMQIEHEKITKAKAGDQIGLEVTERVYEGCEVFKL